ncbi:hypothetical protein GJV52_02610 [Neisseria brasiliensis]|nr:hypothetical protein GJV52_02610 [Neisseria brasiliensis]
MFASTRPTLPVSNNPHIQTAYQDKSGRLNKFTHKSFAKSAALYYNGKHSPCTRERTASD